MITALATTLPAQPRLQLDNRSKRSFTFEFTEVVSVRELSDGRVLVADRKERSLYVADPATAKVAPIGRVGAGPQEFGAIGMLIGARADSTFMYDLRNRRWLVLVGTEIRETVTPSEMGMPEVGAVARGRDFSGRLLVSTGRALGSIPKEAHVPDTSALLLVRARVSGADSIGVLASLGGRAILAGGAAEGSPTKVTIVSPIMAVDDQAILFSDGWVASISQSASRITWTAPGGVRSMSAALPSRSREFDAKERAAYATHLEKLGRTKPDAAPSLRWPKYVPPFAENALTPAPDGSVVVKLTFDVRDPATRYVVVNRSGAVAGQFALAENEEVVGSGSESLFTVRYGTSGEQTLIRHPWPRP